MVEFVTTLLRQIQDLATDPTMPVATLLRKAMILARRLDYPPLGEWAERELEGYPDDAELPEYRAYRSCQVLGDFSGPAGSGLRNQPLPPGAVAEEHRRGLFGFELRDGIPKYEQLMEAGDGGSLSMPWNGDFVVHYQADFFELMALSSARRVVSPGDLGQLVEAVRTRLLNFSLEIEAANPDAGEANAGTRPVPVDEVSSAFHVTVMGDNNVVNAAGRDATQTISFEGERWDELREVLLGVGVPNGELDRLRAALESDTQQQLPPGSMGPATAQWYERLMDAARGGAVALTTEAAGGVIAAELLKFLGAS